MKVISKYLYSELLKPFLIFSFTFIGILWLVQILPKLETLVLNKQPLAIFFNVAMHTIPQVAYFVIPVAAFFSTIYAINKLTTEAEIVAISSSGFSFLSFAKIIFLFRFRMRVGIMKTRGTTLVPNFVKNVIRKLSQKLSN